MVTEAGKELLRNTINTAKFHNRILEENEMWKQWELECGLTMMVSDDDIIKKIQKSSHQCSKHSKRDKSHSRDRSRSKYESTKIRHGAGSSNDRWDHSGFAELYPDAAVPEKYPPTSVSTQVKHKKKKKKSRRRSNSSDKEIWEEFKRPDKVWSTENTLRLIKRLGDAPALWNIDYPGYKDQNLKMRELKRMASEFHVREHEIRDEIEFLITMFHKEHEKRKRLPPKLLENEWFAYEHLKFLKNYKNERECKPIENNIGKAENPILIDSSDSYSDSEEEKFAQPTAHQSRCVKSIQNEKSDEHSKKANDTGPNLPNIQRCMVKKDSFSDFGEFVADEMRQAKKSSKAVRRAKIEIDLILHKLEKGFFDSPEDTFK